MVIALTPAREQELHTRMMRGVEALDATTPNWWKDIDLERLNLKDCVNCVLGQLYNNYTTGVQALTELLDENHLHADEHFDDSTGHIVASHYGFDHDDELQCEWADEDDNLMEQGGARCIRLPRTRLPPRPRREVVGRTHPQPPAGAELMPKHLKPIPKENRKALLAATVKLVEDGKVAFTPTANEYVWKAAEGEFKWTLSRSKDCHFCLAVYSANRPPVFIRSSGGELQGLFYDLLYLSRAPRRAGVRQGPAEGARAALRGAAVTYIKPHMRKAFADHKLRVVCDTEDVKVFLMHREGTGIMRTQLAFTPEGIHITGDVCLGRDNSGIGTTHHKPLGWFAQPQARGRAKSTCARSSSTSSSSRKPL
jgi:hypothetical protein